MAQMPRSVLSAMPIGRPPEPCDEVLHAVSHRLRQSAHNENHPLQCTHDVLERFRQKAVHCRLHPEHSGKKKGTPGMQKRQGIRNR